MTKMKNNFVIVLPINLSDGLYRISESPYQMVERMSE